MPLTLKDLYGEKGAAQFKQRVAAQQRSRGPRPVPGVQSGGPRVHTASPGPFGVAFADMIADRERLDAKLTELDAAFKMALKKYGFGTGLFPGDQIIQDVFGGGAVASALKQTYKSLQLLGGPLYKAAIGQHVFPLDDGVVPNPSAALGAWNQLAQSAQDTIVGVLGYMTTWGPLPGLKKVAEIAANPLNWPWWLKLGAGAVIAVYGMQLLGVVGGARTAFAGQKSQKSLGFPTVRGYRRRKRRK